MNKDLLILEMERAIELLKASETPFKYEYNIRNQDSAELKRLLLSIRLHSIQVEKDPKYSNAHAVVIG